VQLRLNVERRVEAAWKNDFILEGQMVSCSKMTGSDTPLRDMEEGSEGMVKYATMILGFIKKDVFQERNQVTVEEVVTLIAALTDISVTLLSKFRKDEVEPSKATEVGRDVFKYLVGRMGFDVDRLAGKSNIYV